MTQIDLQTAAARLAELVVAATAGEEVVIADAAGRPVVRLVTTQPDARSLSRPRRWAEEQLAAARARGFGTFVGSVRMADDCFDMLTDEELEDMGL